MQSSLNEVLGSLEAAGLIRPAGGADQVDYRIRHALVQDTAYHSILRSERREIHRAVGETLRRLFPEAEIASVLAHHFERAEVEKLAYKYHLMAADAAYNQYANFEAVDHYERAFAYLETDVLERDELIRVHRYYGRALELIGEFERTLEVLDRLIEHAEERADPGMKMIALIGQARLQATMTPVRDPNSAKELAERALELAREQDDLAGEVRTLWVLLLRDMYHESDLDAAEEYGLQALQKARELGEDRPLALVITDLARLYMTKGLPEKGLELVDEGYELWRRDGNLVMQVDVCTLIGGLSLLTGDLNRSRSAFDEALRVSREIDNPWGAAVALANSAMTDHMQGRPGAALERLARARDIADEADIPAARHVIAFFMSWILPDLGAVERGIRFSKRVLEQVESLMSWHRALIWGNWARLEVQRGDLDRAGELLEQAREKQREGDSVGWLFDPVPMAEIELAAATGDYAGAVEKSRDLLQSMDARGSTVFIPELLCHLASAQLELGRADEAMAALERARTVAERIGLRGDLWRIHVETARVHTQAGRDSASAEARGRAHEEINQMLDRIDDPSLRDTFRNRPLVAQILEREGSDAAR